MTQIASPPLQDLCKKSSFQYWRSNSDGEQVEYEQKSCHMGEW